MFLHHDGWEYYAVYFERIGRILKSKNLKENDKKELNQFHKTVLPELNNHLKNIKKHFSNDDHLLSQIHKSINSTIILPKLNNRSKLSKGEKQLHTNMNELYKLYNQISQRTPDKLEGFVNLRTKQFSKIYNLSKAIAKTIDISCKESKEVSQVLANESSDFQNNIVSWINNIKD